MASEKDARAQFTWHAIAVRQRAHLDHDRRPASKLVARWFGKATVCDAFQVFVSGTDHFGKGGLDFCAEDREKLRNQPVNVRHWSSIIKNRTRLFSRISSGCTGLTDPNQLQAGCLGCVCAWLVLQWEAAPKLTFRLKIAMRIHHKLIHLYVSTSNKPSKPQHQTV